MTFKKLKERQVEVNSSPITFKTNEEYKEHIKALHDEAISLRIKLLDMSCTYDNIIRKIQLLENERCDKFDKAITKKTKKAVKKARGKSQ